VQGLDAIAAHNGWAMAVTGACIVMVGLATLSIIISQLHKVVRFIEKKKPERPAPSPVPKAEPKRLSIDPAAVLLDLEATASAFKSISEPLGETFSLVSLYRLLEAEQDPHPHITVRELREAGYLAPKGEGSYSWNKI
jgi:Na+-transporting methylmalonyl-CoA/oxaloacetate decarboxylase gamma subunit